MDKIDELIKTLIRRTTDYGSVPCEEDAQMAMLDIEATRAALRAEFERMEKENAALKEALDISHKNHDRCNRDYVPLKKHLDGINRAVDVLCPKVARAITKLTPPSIADAYRADHQFARELRAALNDVTDAQNTVYKPEAE